MMQQEHEDEVRTLRQEKYALQQKLQEAEAKWNHYITEQGLQVTMVTLQYLYTNGHAQNV